MIAQIRATLNPSFGDHFKITWASIAASTSWTQSHLYYGESDRERFWTELGPTVDLQNPLKAVVEKRWERYLKEGVLETADLSFCKVPLSLFADPERILRRLYVFTEEPCKSTTTTSEPCSPVFKEAQPRPSEHSN